MMKTIETDIAKLRTLAAGGLDEQIAAGKILQDYGEGEWQSSALLGPAGLTEADGKRLVKTYRDRDALWAAETTAQVATKRAAAAATPSQSPLSQAAIAARAEIEADLEKRLKEGPPRADPDAPAKRLIDAAKRFRATGEKPTDAELDRLVRNYFAEWKNDKGRDALASLDSGKLTATNVFQWIDSHCQGKRGN